MLHYTDHLGSLYLWRQSLTVAERRNWQEPCPSPPPHPLWPYIILLWIIPLEQCIVRNIYNTLSKRDQLWRTKLSFFFSKRRMKPSASTSKDAHSHFPSILNSCICHRPWNPHTLPPEQYTRFFIHSPHIQAEERAQIRND